VSNGVTFADEFGYGQVAPIIVCSTTSTGAQNYYASGPNDNPSMNTQGGAVGAVTQDCASPCLCDSAGQCFTSAPPDGGSALPTLVLYPYCSSPSSCFVAVILASDGTLVNSASNAVAYDSGNQLDANFDPLPVTDSAYMKAKSIGCNGCPVDMGQ
jgi:hypothetical protein